MLLPIDDDYGSQNPTGRPLTVFTDLLPYIEQANQNPASAKIIKMLLCPSRRPNASSPFDDYGAVHHVDWGFRGNAAGWFTVLGGPYLSGGPPAADARDDQRWDFQHASLWPQRSCAEVLRRRKPGSLRPAPHGLQLGLLGWRGTVGDHWEHKRNPCYIVQDNYDPENMQYYMSTPHPNVMPCALSDGSVRNLRVGMDAETLCRLWTYNDGLVVSPD